MNAVDTNVLLYRLDRRDPIKQTKARDLLRQLAVDTTPTVIPWQVIGELGSQLRRWQDQNLITRDALLRYVSACRKLFPTAMPDPAVIDIALDLAGRYSLSHWDSMIVAASINAGVDTLYTEDMGAPIVFDSVQLLNPFA